MLSAAMPDVVTIGVVVVATCWPPPSVGRTTVFAKAASSNDEGGAWPSYGGNDVAIERTLYSEPGLAAA